MTGTLHFLRNKQQVEDDDSDVAAVDKEPPFQG